ncbi:hypothetical protein GGF32_004038 [Allomyces javanicus]|nr:hypothetical protein GGF32_004038 [Allomyces javanicus]
MIPTTSTAHVSFLTWTGTISPYPDTPTTLKSGDMIALMVVSLLLSVAILAWSAYQWSRRRTKFNLAVIILAFLFLFYDVYYFVAVATGRVHAYFVELVRGVTGFFAAAHIPALAIWRFSVFAETPLASWYSIRVRNTLLAINYLLEAVIGGFLVWTVVDPPSPHRDSRRPLLFSIFMTWAVVIDLILNVFTFYCVLHIHRHLDPSMAGCRIRSSLVLFLLVALAAVSVVFMVVFNEHFTTWGQSMTGIGARIYALLAMGVWYLIVDIVKHRNRALPSFLAAAVHRPSAPAGLPGLLPPDILMSPRTLVASAAVPPKPTYSAVNGSSHLSAGSGSGGSSTCCASRVWSWVGSSSDTSGASAAAGLRPPPRTATASLAARVPGDGRSGGVPAHDHHHVTAGQ